MSTNLFSLFFALLFFIASSIQAQSKVLLRLNLHKGTTYEMTMASVNQINQEMMGQKMKIDQKMEMVFSYVVVDVLPDKNFLIEYSFLKMKLDMDINGQKVVMDSESDSTDPMNASIKDLISLKLKLTLNPKGEVQKVEGLEEYGKKLSGNPQMAQTMQMFIDENNFKTFFAQTFNYFPENEVAVGEQWKSTIKMPALMNTAIVMVFEVAAIENNQVHLNVESVVDTETQIEQMGMKMDVKMAGKQSGKMILDAADGWVSSSDLIQRFDMNMKMKNPQNGEDVVIPMIMNSTVKITVNKKQNN
jgi:hypothetical protein